VNVLTAALQGAFNGSTGTLLIFAKVFNVGVWTDATIRTALHLYADGSNYQKIAKSSTNNIVAFNSYMGGSAEFYSLSNSAIDWQLYAQSWDTPGDAVKYYHNDTLKETDTGIGTWAGILARAVLGVPNASVPSQAWYGYLSHAVICDYAATQAQISAVYAGSV
jgi:hypothetical protein